MVGIMQYAAGSVKISAEHKSRYQKLGCSGCSKCRCTEVASAAAQMKAR